MVVGATAARDAVGLTIALGFPLLPVAAWVDEFAGVGHLIGYEAIWWAVVAVVVAQVLLVERRPLSSIGIRAMRRADLLLAVATALALIAALAIIYFAVFPWLGISASSSVDRLLATPLWWRAISVLRAAVAEEVLFRGYAIERLAAHTKGSGAAALISVVVFTVAHVGPWGWGHLLVAGCGGAMLTALYLWRRNLWANMIAHAIVDGVAVLA